jgi:hypothetical protein
LRTTSPVFAPRAPRCDFPRSRRFFICGGRAGHASLTLAEPKLMSNPRIQHNTNIRAVDCHAPQASTVEA